MKNIKRERSSVWAMINWAIIQDQIKLKTGLIPDQDSIEETLKSLENEYSEEKLFFMEARNLEKLLIQRLVSILHKHRGKEIKKKRSIQARNTKNQGIQKSKVGIRVFPMGSLDELKKMGLDPEMMDQFSKAMMDQLFGHRKKKGKDDDDEDDDPGSSFYM